MSCRRVFTLIALPLLAACGTSGSDPCKPAQVNFSVQGTTGTPFDVVFFQTNFRTGDPTCDSNPQLQGCYQAPSTDLIAPHTFYFLNANPAVRGKFKADPHAIESVPVVLRNPDLVAVGTTVIPVCTDSTCSSTERILTTPAPPTNCPVASTGPEVRVEIFSPTGLFNVPFTLTIGDEGSSFLACGTSQVCGTPSTVYFANAINKIDAVINKIVVDNQVVAIQLWVNGALRDSDQATQDDTTGKVHLDL